MSAAEPLLIPYVPDGWAYEDPEAELLFRLARAGSKSLGIDPATKVRVFDRCPACGAPRFEVRYGAGAMELHCTGAEWCGLVDQLKALRYQSGHELEHDFALKPANVVDFAARRLAGDGLFPLTDLGNAERLQAAHGDQFRYVPAWNTFLVYDGTRWRRDETGEVRRMAADVVRQMYRDAADLPTEEQRKALSRHAIRSESGRALKNMVECVQWLAGVAVEVDALDTDPYALNVSNGTLDLRTGELRDHDPADLITRLVPVKFDAAAACPVWDRFLSEVMKGRGDLIGFLQRAVGYSLSGDTSERKLFILHGGGRNGKSTFLETVREMIPDYAARVPTKMLTVKEHGAEGIPNDLARLKGVRYVTASETAEGRRLDEALLKDITGRETITARFMRAEWFDFVPQFKLWLSTNHKPQIRGTDDGIWDRIALIPFDLRVEPHQEDRALPAKLRAELPGILAWAVRGFREWQANGLGQAEAVEKATRDYRSEMDWLADFLTACCVEHPTATTPAKALYERYEGWCRDNSEQARTTTAFGRALARRGYIKSKNRAGSNVWTGIGIRTNEPPPQDAPPDSSTPTDSCGQFSQWKLHEESDFPVTGGNPPQLSVTENCPSSADKEGEF